MNHPVLLLLYHRVNDTPREHTTSTADFRAHLHWLSAHGYRSVSMGEFERILNGQFEPGPRRFMLTFDDGYADLAACAPIIREFSFTAVAFVVTDFLGTDSTYLDWSTLARLTASGTLEAQSHSHSHAPWALDPAHVDLVSADLRRSRELLCEHLGSPVENIRHLAWPWGRCTVALEQAALQCGFQYQYLVQRGALSAQGMSLRLPRLCCDGFSETRFASWVRLLSWRPGAELANHCFGNVRRWRRGMGYTGSGLK